jgi:hypothetical protein
MEDNENIYRMVDGALTVLDMETGDKVAESGKWIKPLVHPKYCLPLSERVCMLVRGGRSYKQVAQEMGFPGVQTIYHWRNMHPDFSEDLKAARRDRGDYYHDQVMEIADGEIEKEDVPVLKLRSDIYKWGAEKANPKEYGNQTKITGDSDSPLQIIVDTGIKREGDNESIDGELATKELDTKENQTSHEDGEDDKEASNSGSIGDGREEEEKVIESEKSSGDI